MQSMYTVIYNTHWYEILVIDNSGHTKFAKGKQHFNIFWVFRETDLLYMTMMK